MTSEQAIDTLKDMKGYFNDRSHRQYSMPALDLAISALEKQTEKTPEAHYIGEGDLSFECKVCEQTVNEGSFYCWYCGQNLLDEQWKNPIKAIDWSVEE